MSPLLQEVFVASVLGIAALLYRMIGRRVWHRRARVAAAAIATVRPPHVSLVLPARCKRMGGLDAETYCLTHSCAASMPCQKEACPHCGH